MFSTENRPEGSSTRESSLGWAGLLHGLRDSLVSANAASLPAMATLQKTATPRTHEKGDCSDHHAAHRL